MARWLQPAVVLLLGISVARFVVFVVDNMRRSRELIYEADLWNYAAAVQERPGPPARRETLP
jgi:hypothetical protein